MTYVTKEEAFEAVAGIEHKELDPVHDILCELAYARGNFAPMVNAHHGWGLLREEVDELWDEVKLKTENRDPVKMRKEAVQVAAMALMFIIDVCDGGLVNKPWKREYQGEM